MKRSIRLLALSFLLMLNLSCGKKEKLPKPTAQRGIVDSLEKGDSIRWQKLMDQHLEAQLRVRKLYDSIYNARIDSARRQKIGPRF